MLYFFEGVFFGMLVAIAPGPSTLYVIKKTIEYGGRSGISAILGIVVTDFLYAVLTLFGVSSLLTRFPDIEKVFWLLNGAILIFIGRSSFQKGRFMRDSHKSRPFLGGFFLNIFNPATVVFWITVSFLFFLRTDTASLLYLSAGVLLGVFMFSCAVVFFTIHMRSKNIFPELWWKRASDFIGIVLFVAGIYFLYRWIRLV